MTGIEAASGRPRDAPSRRGSEDKDGMSGARRLAAILAADVAGYSRLVGADEEGTVARLKSIRAAIVDPSIAGNHGRIVNTAGDSVLAEFASVVDAVRAALAIQSEIAQHNAPEPPDQRIEFRIGIHLGDVMVHLIHKFSSSLFNYIFCRLLFFVQLFLRAFKFILSIIHLIFGFVDVFFILFAVILYFFLRSFKVIHL